MQFSLIPVEREFTKSGCTCFYSSLSSDPAAVKTVR